MKKIIVYIIFGSMLNFLFTSCATPIAGGQDYNRKFYKKESYKCGIPKAKKPKWAKVKYS